jgi:hypothetical protein
MQLTPEKIEELDTLSKIAAKQIVDAVSVFKNEPVEIQQRAMQVVMARVQRLMNGENYVIDDPSLTKVIEDGEETPTS